MADDTPSTPKTYDGCPDWAQRLIMNMREIEVHLGNIPDSDTWLTDDMDRLYGRAFRGELEASDMDSDKVDALFRRVTWGLAREGYDPEDIVTFVNTRIGYKGGPPYCNAREVEEAIRLGND